MAGLIIRQADSGDSAQVFFIETESSGGWPLALFESEFKNGFSRTIIAEAGAEPAGYAIVWLIENDLQLNKISVRPKFRRGGIASALIKYLKDEFNPSKIMLEVAERNLSAIRLYESAGFIRTGFRKNYYPDDNAILMDYTANEN